MEYYSNKEPNRACVRVCAQCSVLTKPFLIQRFGKFCFLSVKHYMHVMLVVPYIHSILNLSLCLSFSSVIYHLHICLFPPYFIHFLITGITIAQGATKSSTFQPHIPGTQRKSCSTDLLIDIKK